MAVRILLSGGLLGSGYSTRATPSTTECIFANLPQTIVCWPGMPCPLSNSQFILVSCSVPFAIQPPNNNRTCLNPEHCPSPVPHVKAKACAALHPGNDLESERADWDTSLLLLRSKTLVGLLAPNIPRTESSRARSPWSTKSSAGASSLSGCLLLGIGGTRGVRRLSPILLDNVLHALLCFIPVVRVQLDEVNAVVQRDFVQSIETPLVVDEADAHTDTAKASRAADSVEVRLKVGLEITPALHGNVVVDDHRDTRDIDTSGKNVGGDEDLVLARSELGQKGISVRAIIGGVKSRHFVSILGHATLDLIRAFSGLPRDWSTPHSILFYSNNK